MTRSFATSRLHRDTNRAGGIEAGVSNGEEIVVRAAMKPLPTLMRPLERSTSQTGEPAEALVERSDTAAVEALAVVAEAAVAFELARAAREKFGGDALVDFVAAHRPTWSGSTGSPARDRHLALVGFMGAGQDDARRARSPGGSAGRSSTSTARSSDAPASRSPRSSRSAARPAFRAIEEQARARGAATPASRP